MPSNRSKPVSPLDLFAIDGLLSDEERAMRDLVRSYGARELRPHVADWFEAGTLPARERRARARRPRRARHAPARLRLRRNQCA